MVADLEHREVCRARHAIAEEAAVHELALLVEAEEARAVLRDRWSGTESDAERLRIVEEAAVHVRRQLDLVESRRARLDEFATELETKLEAAQGAEKKTLRDQIATKSVAARVV